jgi:tetratricopeptide (TPR) repeat protein
MQSWIPLVTLCLAAAAQDAPPSIEDLMASANARYLHREYAASRDLYEQARQLIEQGPAEDARRYAVLQRLATVASAAADYPAALTYVAAAIQWRIDRFGPDDATALENRLKQVGIYRAMGDATQARTTLEGIIEKHEELGGRRNPALAADHSLMGQIDLDTRKKEDAAGEWELAIALRSLAAGPLDVTQVPDLDRLGAVYIDLLRYPDAENTFRKALIIRESVLGAEHADLLSTLDGLAYAYFGQKKYAEAEPVYQRLVALWKKSVGETHPMLAVAFDKLAVFYIAQEKFTEAQEAYQPANAIRTLNLARGLNRQAEGAAAAGDTPAAAELQRRALRALDPPDPLYAPLRDELSRGATPETAPAKTAPKSLPKK